MGFFGKIIASFIPGLKDISELADLEERIFKAIEALIDEGKCPDDLKNAYLAAKGEENRETSEGAEVGYDTLRNLASALNQHKALLPDNISSHINDFLNLVDKVEEDVKKANAAEK